MYVPFPFPWPPPLSAPADSGTTSVRAASADIAKRRPPRPPDPQRAFLRDSPREPLPQSAFERVPRRQPVEFRICRCSSCRAWRGPQFPFAEEPPRPSERRLGPSEVRPPVGGGKRFPHSRESDVPLGRR